MSVDIHDVITCACFCDDRVKGFGRGNGANFPFSHWLASSPLQHSRTTVWVCVWSAGEVAVSKQHSSKPVTETSADRSPASSEELCVAFNWVQRVTLNSGSWMQHIILCAHQQLLHHLKRILFGLGTVYLWCWWLPCLWRSIQTARSWLYQTQLPSLDYGRRHDVQPLS